MALASHVGTSTNRRVREEDPAWLRGACRFGVWTIYGILVPESGSRAAVRVCNCAGRGLRRAGGALWRRVLEVASAWLVKEWRMALEHMANKPLVPTRNGEAPLLAAQRRR